MGNTTKKTEQGFTQDVILIDLQKWLVKILSYWWLFLLSVALAFAAGKLYLRYATYEYTARAILLIKDTGSSGVVSEQSILLSDQATIGGSKAMDNEIQILKSLTLMEKVVERLGIDVSYFRKGTIKEGELYQESPFLLETYSFNQEMEFGANFYIELKDYQTFELKLSEESDEGENYAFGVPFENKLGKFLISYNSAVAIIPGEYRLSISPVENIARRYSANLLVKRIGDHTASSVLEISIVDPVPEKARDILNTLIDVYNEEEIQDENIIFRNTLAFIDMRVAHLLTELDSIEGGVQDFKSANSIITDNASSSLNFALSETRSAVQSLSAYEVQREILKSLEGFLEDDKKTFDLIPANLIAENPVLSGLVNQYNELVMRRNSMLTTASQLNPSRIAMEEQIVNIGNLIQETIRNLQRDLQIPMDKLENNIRQLERDMSSIPGVEKRLVEKMRTQSIKENLFLYLLQKREETALSEAITTAKTRTIDRARASKGPVYPRKNLVLVSSVVMGLFLPLLFIIIRSFFEIRVNSEETINQLTTIPILGRIAESKEKENIVVKMGSRSGINEMFRLIRANLNFVNLNKDRQTLMVTSSISGEGKTFMVLNLGITLALSQKRVILLDMDLRKPKLGANLGVSPADNGISNYLIGQCELEDIIRPYEGNSNLFFISSGAVPPNPTELLISPRMDLLFAELENFFDYILIDTPPIRLVSDALLLRKYTSSILIVVRHHYTKKSMLQNLDKMYQNDELDGASLIYNGIRYGRKYGYSNDYSYGYDQGYYIDEK